MYAEWLRQFPNVDFVLVGMGTPRSEEVRLLASKICARAVLWHVGGGTLGVLAGTKRPAPKWASKRGMPFSLFHRQEAQRRAALCTFFLPTSTTTSPYTTTEFARVVQRCSCTPAEAARSGVDSVQFSVATPYPGTAFYEELEREGRINHSSWDDFDGYNTSVVTYPAFPTSYLHDFARTSNGRWLRAKLAHPRWLLRQARYLARLTRRQGLGGFRKRLMRVGGIIAESLPSPISIRR